MSQLNSGNVPSLDGGHLDEELQREISEALGEQSYEQMMAAASAGPGEAGGEESSGKPASQLVRGKVAEVRGEDVFVNLHGWDGKFQGVVPLSQFERSPRVNSIMDFVVQAVDESQGLVILSREGAVGRATWDTLAVGQNVEARVTGVNKGGLELELVGSIKAFMPASQVDVRFVDGLEGYVGQKLQATVEKIDRKAKSVVLSRRRLLEAQKKALREKLWKEIEVGQVRSGVVTSVMEYGAFVDLGGADGLVHVSDMSYQRVEKPAEVLKVGQGVEVKVLKLDRENERISLGIKQVQPDPWEEVLKRVKAREHVTGRVVRLVEFGAFVELEPGVEGLAPVSELSWKRVHKPAEVLTEGEVKRWLILEVDGEKKRISLSLKQAEGDPWVGAERRYAKNSLVEGTVLSVTEFGAFVEIQPGLEGLVHISELADRKVNRVEDVMGVGQKHQLRVLDIDETKKRVRLSLRAVTNPRGDAESEAGEATAATPFKPVPKKPMKRLKGGIE